jgi:hypothetical protein
VQNRSRRSQLDEAKQLALTYRLLAVIAALGTILLIALVDRFSL